MVERNPFMAAPQAGLNEGNPFMAAGMAPTEPEEPEEPEGVNPFMTLPAAAPEAPEDDNPFMALPGAEAVGPGPISPSKESMIAPAPRVPFSGLPPGAEPPMPRRRKDEGSGSGSGLGRVGGAAVEAVRDLFSGPVGLSSEALGPLVAQSPEQGRGALSPARTFNQVLLQGGSQAVDLGFRLVAAPFFAAIAAVGQTAQEMGVSETQSRKLERDLHALLLAAGVASGGAPAGASFGRGKARRGKRATPREIYEEAEARGTLDAALSELAPEAREAAKAQLRDSFEGGARMADSLVEPKGLGLVDPAPPAGQRTASFSPGERVRGQTPAGPTDRTGARGVAQGKQAKAVIADWRRLPDERGDRGSPTSLAALEEGARKAMAKTAAEDLPALRDALVKEIETYALETGPTGSTMSSTQAFNRWVGAVERPFEGAAKPATGGTRAGAQTLAPELEPEILVTQVTTAKGRKRTWKGPMDMVTYLRSEGGIKDFQGEVKALGVSNSARELQFTGGENFLGALVKRDGLPLDEAALRAYEAGYFNERPSINDFLIALDDTFSGRAGRKFRPGDDDFMENLRLTELAEDIVPQSHYYNVDIEGMSDAEAWHAVEAAKSLREGTTRPARAADLDAAAPVQGTILSPDMTAMLKQLEERAPEGAPKPWQVSRDEFVAEASRQLLRDGASPASAAKKASEAHRESVRGALAQKMNVPPEVTGYYPDLVGLHPRMAGNIRLDKLEGVEDIAAVLGGASRAKGGFVRARRGVVSEEETRRLADALGMPEKQLLKRRRGQAFNAEEALRARELLATSADDLVKLAGEARGGSDEQLFAFQRAYLRHVAIQEQVAGMTAEAGRTLNQFKMRAQSDEARARAIKGLIEGRGGRERIEEIAEMMAELDTPEKVARFARDSFKAKTSDMLLEAWINGLLSGLSTQVVNVTSNALVALWTIPEHVLASGIGALRGGPNRIFAAEIPARMYGLVEGAKEGLRLAGRTFFTEMTTDRFVKIEARRFQAIPSKTFRKGVAKKTVRVAGRDVPVPLTGEIVVGGRQVRIPGRALMAGDEFFKAIGYRMELNARAVRQATKEGLTGRAFAERVEAIKAAPSDEINFAAIDTARYQTFTKPLGKTGRAVQSFASSHPTARIVIPFVRTMLNIVKFAGERSPFGFFMKEVKDALKAGGPERDLALARMGFGTTVGIGTAALALEGHITGGGPANPELRAAKYNTGWQPYSVKVGDQYYSYGRLEPLGMVLGISADFTEIAGELQKDERDRIAGMILASISKNLTSKTFTRGLSELVEAVADPERYGDRYIRRLAGTVVPTGVSHVARVRDPVLRETRSIIDGIKSRLPGYSETLPPRRNVWGEPILLEGGLGPDIISPFYTSRDRHDAVADEVVRLKLKIKRIGRKIGGVELTPAQYEEYQILAGPPAKVLLDVLVAQPGYHRTRDPIKLRLFKAAIKEARDTARGMMYERYPELVREKAAAKAREFVGGR